MSLTMLGKKRGMTRLFDQKTGKVTPCTVIEVQPNVITQIKTQEKHGYSAIQLASGALSVSEKRRMRKPQAGEFAAKKIEPRKNIVEARDGSLDGAEVGKEIAVDYFKEGEYVDVRGRSKGKGFQGRVKRHGISMTSRSHGAGPIMRHGGSIGSLTAHGRVQKGKRMSGHMGDENVVTEGLEVLKVDVSLNALIVKGAIPGANGGVVTIRNAMKKKS